MLVVIIASSTLGTSAVTLCIGIGIGFWCGIRNSKKQRSINIPETPVSPVPVYEEVDLVGKCHDIELSSNVAYNTGKNCIKK